MVRLLHGHSPLYLRNHDVEREGLGMVAELAAHLGHDSNQAFANDSGNTRNGSSAKTLKGTHKTLKLSFILGG